MLHAQLFFMQRLLGTTAGYMDSHCVASYSFTPYSSAMARKRFWVGPTHWPAQRRADNTAASAGGEMSHQAAHKCHVLARAC